MADEVKKATGMSSDSGSECSKPIPSIDGSGTVETVIETETLKVSVESCCPNVENQEDTPQENKITDNNSKCTETKSVE